VVSEPTPTERRDSVENALTVMQQREETYLRQAVTG
jgi:hypothetical protein